jgi:hypothetical protein
MNSYMGYINILRQKMMDAASAFDDTLTRMKMENVNLISEISRLQDQVLQVEGRRDPWSPISSFFKLFWRHDSR